MSIDKKELKRRIESLEHRLEMAIGRLCGAESVLERILPEVATQLGLDICDRCVGTGRLGAYRHSVDNAYGVCPVCHGWKYVEKRVKQTSVPLAIKKGLY